MSVISKINELRHVKNNIKQSIENKNVNLDDVEFRNYSSEIEGLETGGGFLGDYNFWDGTAAEYDLIDPKDNNTFYLIFLRNKEIIKVYQGDKEVYSVEVSGGIPARYVQTSVEDYDSSGNYTGTEAYIILPSEKTSGYKITNSAVKGVATDGDYLTSAENMFNGFAGEDLEVLYLDTSNVTDMSYMFNNSQATSFDLSSFDTSNVTNMYGMFYNSQATSLDLSSFNTSKVTSMREMFYNSQATSFDLSSFDTSNVTNMYGMFYNSQATSFDLSSFDTSKVTDMRSMFNLSQATTGYARNQTEADKFNNSHRKPSTLTFVVKGPEEPEEPWYIPSYYVQTSIHDFDWEIYNGNEEYIILPNEPAIGFVGNPSEFSGYRIKSSAVKGVATKSDCLYNMYAMFEDFPGTSLELLYLNTSNVTDMRYMFNNSQATSLDLSSFDTSNVTSMNSMFNNSQATSLDLSSFDTSKVTDMNYMFRGSQATSLDLSSFNTSKVTSMREMFATSQATSFDLSSFDTSKVTDRNYMFYLSQATTGYARNQTEANKFNNSYGKPSALTFVVKP